MLAELMGRCVPIGFVVAHIEISPGTLRFIVGHSDGDQHVTAVSYHPQPNIQ
jgi:hypothetical protein